MYRVNKVKKLADNFFKLTMIKSAADLDENASSLIYFLNREINKINRGIDTEDAIASLKRLKEEYKEAVHINGGFQLIDKRINNIIDEYGDLIEDNLEEVIDNIGSDIINRAEQIDPRGLDAPPSPQKEKMVRDAGRVAELRMREDEESGGAEYSYDEGQESEREKEEDFGSEYSTAQPGDDDFAKLEISKSEDGGITGVQFTNRDYVNWTSRYEDKAKRILRQAKQVGTPDAAEKANDLKDLYNKLGAYVEYMQTVKNKISEVIEPMEKEQWKQKFIDANKNVAELRENVRTEKQKFENIRRAKYIQELKDDLPKIKDETEKFIKEQEIAIAERTNSGDKFIKPLQSLRRGMISKLKGKIHKDRRTGAEVVYGKLALTPEVIKDFNDKVEEAKKQIISLEEWRKQKWQERKQQLGAIPEEEAVQKGIELLPGHRIYYDIKNMELPKLITLFSKKIANTKMGEKKVITDQFKKDPKAIESIKPIISKLQNSVIKGSRSEYTEILKELNNKIRENMDTVGKALPAFIRYEAHLRSSRQFSDIQEMLTTLKTMLYEGSDQKDTLSPEDISLIKTIIDKSEPLVEVHGKTDTGAKKKIDPKIKETATEKELTNDIEKAKAEGDAEKVKELESKLQYIQSQPTVVQQMTGNKAYLMHLTNAADILQQIIVFLKNMIDDQNVTKAGRVSLRTRLLKKLSQEEPTADFVQQDYESPTEEITEPTELETPEVYSDNVPDWVSDWTQNVLDTLIDRNVQVLMSEVEGN